MTRNGGVQSPGTGGAGRRSGSIASGHRGTTPGEYSHSSRQKISSPAAPAQNIRLGHASAQAATINHPFRDGRSGRHLHLVSNGRVIGRRRVVDGGRARGLRVDPGENLGPVGGSDPARCAADRDPFTPSGQVLFFRFRPARHPKRCRSAHPPLWRPSRRPTPRRSPASSGMGALGFSFVPRDRPTGRPVPQRSTLCVPLGTGLPDPRHRGEMPLRCAPP